MKKHELSIKSYNDKAISIDYRYCDSDKPLIPIVYVHGFKGFKDWGSSNEIANYFAEHGFLFLKFNFSHNGVSKESPCDFVDLDAFSENNYWIEFQELGLVINWLEYSDLPIDFSKLALIGHSRGGGITLLRTAQDSRIQKAITWASVSDFEKRFPEDVSDWKAKGVEYIYNGRTQQMMPLNYQFYESFYTHHAELDIPSQCKNIHQKVLVIHGTDDPAVGLEEAQQISSLVKQSQLEIIKDAAHTFGAVHPPVSKCLSEHLTLAVNKTFEFLNS